MKYNKQTYDYFIGLINAFVNDKTPAPKPELVSWSDILSLAIFHKVEEIIFKSVDQLKDRPSMEISRRFFNSRNHNKLADIMQIEEGKVIVDNFRKNEIDVIALKGWVLKGLYPKPEYRQMGDIDYLVRAKDIDKCIPIMKLLGYEAEDVGLDASHDEYGKKPYMKVEIHRRLLPPTEENHWYTDDIWDRLVEDKPHIYHMTKEDFYLYHLLHFEKHFSMGGSGVRSILDHYYILKHWKDDIDWEYVDSIIEKMNYVYFQSMTNQLAIKWFGGEEFIGDRLDENILSEDDLFDAGIFILDSGAFGTEENYQKWYFNKLKKENNVKSKKGFIFRRIFMERSRMENIYPVLKKHGWLLPIMWVRRIVYVLLHRRDRIKSEYKSIKDMEE